MLTTVPAPTSTHRFDPRLLAALGSFCISLSSVFIKVSHVSGSTSAFWRCLFALPVLLLLAGRERRRSPVSRRRVLFPLLAGAGLGLDFVLWGEAIPRVGAGIATVLLAVQVVIVPLLAFAFLAERPSKRFLAAVPVLLGGIVLAGGFAGTGSFGPDPVTGAVAALLAGAGYAGYLFLIRLSGRTGTQAHSLVLATVSAGVVAVVLGVPTGTLDLTPGWPELGWLLALAGIGQLAGWLLISAALPRMSATTGATLMLLQPVGAVLLGIGLLGETPGWAQLIGCAGVVAAVCFAGGGRSARTDLPG
ncbi:Threonine/homoserine efflux transporter RhtA [Amycolatopsis tolypomycina]|uniref:Threonine/homoserine efflux transporter RhtA n=1 Tax=Amycolatopsis tolypomycina TaxID=208445 RepID=A0A1H4YBI4_9PSEU|nr:EamA family transporter [Amycolatopsis tolypomycina]SED15253.1 Threonine/homoserine efflux transporter RhtA [Amycolatopsis tolypomycina]